MDYDLFYRRHRHDLVRLAYSLTGTSEDADDIVAGALASAWEHWARVQAADNPVAYVRRIVVNMAADHVQRRVRERQGNHLLEPMTVWFCHRPDVEAGVDLEVALHTLPVGQRACVVLRHFFGLTPEDVSRTLGISQGTVKSQTWKGLAQLRTVLGEPG